MSLNDRSREIPLEAGATAGNGMISPGTAHSVAVIPPLAIRLRRVFPALLTGVLCLLFAGGTSLGRSSELGEKWGDLQKKYKAASFEIRTKSERDRADLGGKFVAALQKLEADLQTQGQLEALLAVRKEREMFVSSGTLGSEDDPELSRIRTLYVEARKPIDSGEKEEIHRLMKAYLTQLEILQTELTRAGEIQTALVVRNEGEQIRRSLGDAADALAKPLPSAPASTEILERFESVPQLTPPPADPDIFELKQWPPKVTLPAGNYRIEGNRGGGDDVDEIVLMPGSTFRGADEKARWLTGRRVLVAHEVKFDGFTLHGNLGSHLFFVKCEFKDMKMGKGGGWFGGRFMTRWQFRDCRIEGSFSDRWISKRFGVQMVNCHIERVEFPPIQYEDDDPSDLANQDWAMVRNTHFRKCVIPVSVLSLLDDCSFEECRFVDDPAPLEFKTEISRTLYLTDCQWNIKALPSRLIVDRKKLSERP